MFSFICCIAGAIVLGCGVTGIIDWWEKHPIVEEKQVPFYITKKIY